MATYLINHLRIPGGVPKAEGLEYLEQVEATFEPYGAKWLVLGAHDEVLEGRGRGLRAVTKPNPVRSCERGSS